MEKNASLARENGGLVKEVGHLKEKLESAISGNRFRTYLLGLLAMVAGMQQVALQSESAKDEKLTEAIQEKTKYIDERLTDINSFYQDFQIADVQMAAQEINGLLDESQKGVFQETLDKIQAYNNVSEEPVYNPETGNFEQSN